MIDNKVEERESLIKKIFALKTNFELAWERLRILERIVEDAPYYEEDRRRKLFSPVLEVENPNFQQEALQGMVNWELSELRDNIPIFTRMTVFILAFGIVEKCILNISCIIKNKNIRLIGLKSKLDQLYELGFLPQEYNSNTSDIDFFNELRNAFVHSYGELNEEEYQNILIKFKKSPFVNNSDNIQFIEYVKVAMGYQIKINEFFLANSISWFEKMVNDIIENIEQNI